jgi:hypothetical protein
MARKRKGKDAGSEPSPEFKAFEASMKEILKVPKKEVERREREYKESRNK